MNNPIVEARELIAKARESLRRGDKPSARQLGEQAALLAPDLEDVWLILAASDPNMEDALAYARKAVELNPQSGRARRAVEWVSDRLKRTEASKDRTVESPTIVPNQVEAAAELPQTRAYQTAIAMPALQPQGRNWLFPALLIGAGCMVVGLFALFMLTRPVVASLVRNISAALPTQENLWAPSDIVKPEATPINVSGVAVQVEDTPTSVPTKVPATALPTKEPALAPTDVPTEVPTDEASAPTPAATETPGSMVMEIVPESAVRENESSASSESKPEYPSSGNGARWIDVDLTNQMVYAYEGDVVVNSFVVSTGTWLTPTVTGEYKVYVKIRSGSMSGPGYYLPDVPYIMYFYKSYGLHGTYWHNNFGTPMSHGCVNLRTDEAGWLFNWASVGTVVNVHY